MLRILKRGACRMKSSPRLSPSWLRCRVFPVGRMKKISYESFPVLYIKVSQTADEHKQASKQQSPSHLDIDVLFRPVEYDPAGMPWGYVFLVVNDDSLFYKKLRHIIFPVWLARAIDIVQIPFRSGDRCDVTLLDPPTFQDLFPPFPAIETIFPLFIFFSSMNSSSLRWQRWWIRVYSQWPPTPN